MELALSAAAAIVGVALFWTGIKKVELGRIRHAVLTSADLALAVAAFLQLGWVGLVRFLAVSVLAVVLHSVRLALKKEQRLAEAAARSRTSKEEMEALFRRVYESHVVFRQLGPLRTADLLALLADRARSPDEIRPMATAVGLLWFINGKPELARLVERFDRLLRVGGSPLPKP